MGNRKTPRKEGTFADGRKPQPQNVKTPETGTGVASIAIDEWSFIDTSKCRCPSEDKARLLDYEYAREADAYRVQFASAPTWQQIFGDQFPQTPFLALDPIRRRRLLKQSFEGFAGKTPLFDSSAKEPSLLFQFEHTLNEPYQTQLETVHEEMQEQLKLARPQRLYEDAIAEFKLSLPREAYDETVALVQLTIQLDISDDRLKQEFVQMLASIRRGRKAKSSEHNEVDAKLKRLAATRLYRFFRSVEKAGAFAIEQGFECPYEDDSGWSRARTEVWNVLGVHDFPPNGAV